MRFDYEKNREEITENANIVIALEAYIKSCSEINMDEDFISRYKKTLVKFQAMLNAGHEAQKAYFQQE
jgi:hypothetical protein